MIPTEAQRVWPSTTATAVVGRERQAQQVVRADRVAQHPGVVAQLTDLGRGLVDEAQAAVDHPHRARAEQRIGRPLAQHLGDRGAREVEAVVAHEDVDPGRVAAPDLQAVDGGQGLLDRGVALGGAHDGSLPARSATARAVRVRSRSTAHTASLSR
jgi:hypothetical protein